MLQHHTFDAILIGVLLTGSTTVGSAAGHRIDFNRDVRPILSDKCFACHGPGAAEAKGDLRLDLAASAYAKKESGEIAVVPRNPEASALIARIHQDDPDELMPPPESGKTLSEAEKRTLKNWIKQGANYAAPWAYVSPVMTEPPALKRAEWPVNFIDLYILGRLEAEGLTPSPDADRATLIRRLSFDLTGLPPSPAEVDEFVDDPSPDAYEKAVDRLLASPHFGERMAVWWLDLVRYADTVGYHGDQTQRAWPYRDYVIDAFNANKPFDRFVREQLAGDLLPNPTRSQRIATCYNRLLQTTHEPGVQLKEYRAIYMADRVRNLSQVFMGATVGCAQCHNHKFDPYTLGDFYAMGAFFADIDDERHLLEKPEQLNTLPTQRIPEMAVLTDDDRATVDDLDRQLHALGDRLVPADSGSVGPGATTVEGHTDPTIEVSPQVAALRARREAIYKDAPRVMVTASLASPRVVRVLGRGNWLDETGPIVEPAVPAFLGPLDLPGRRATRLDLANWLVGGADPAQTAPAPSDIAGLTARVQVNRFWQMFMGVGLSRTLDDFGAQGEPPVYPELLDRLAVEFVRSGWDAKRTIKTIVMSRTYRQSSLESDAHRRVDPDNRLHARQSRYRLPAEFVRDNALAVSGLLVRDVGGPSVNIYQPVGYFSHLAFPQRSYHIHDDGRLYRRGVYLHWQRQFLHPMLKAFDAPPREECVALRPQSNTPAQALTLLNDSAFVEAARAFAGRILKEGVDSDADRIRWGFRCATGRAPDDFETHVLAALLAEHRGYFSKHPREAHKVLATGRAPAPPEVDPIELAAWTSVARVLLNMDETIIRN